MNAIANVLKSSNDRAPSKALHIALWVAQIGGAAMFAMAGLAKVTGDPAMVGLFDAVGGQWFRYVTGILELSGAALLLVPALAGVAGLVLAAVMVGALLTHALIGGSPLMALVLLVAMAFVAFGRRDRTAKLLQRLR